jgi:hypothetical protein
MAGKRYARAVLLVLTMVSASFSGCFGEDEVLGIDVDSADVAPKTLTGGIFQPLTISANEDVSVFIPYLIRDNDTGFVYNSTILDLESGDSKQLSILAPPRAKSAVVMFGEYGRDVWPIRDAEESWNSWYLRDGYEMNDNDAIIRSTNMNSTIDYTSEISDSVVVVLLSVNREMAAAYSEDEGGRHSTGVVSGRTTYNYLHHITDETLDPFDLSDGAVGYLNRWAGQGNAAYEDGAVYLMDKLESFGLDVDVQRFAFEDIFGNQNPESYNICGFRYGSEVPDEWMVFGAHFDVAPPANLIADDPHITGMRSYGTRVGAYDNSAGTSMVLTVAEAMANYDTRRTMVFCFWSGEEGGKRGSDYWTDYFVKDENPGVVVTNYINLDMAGVNWPGGGGAPHGDPATAVDPDGYPKDEEVWPMRVYLGPSSSHDVIDQPEMIGLMMWIGSDAINVEQQQKVLLGQSSYNLTQSQDDCVVGDTDGDGVDNLIDNWKVCSWYNNERPEIIVYEDVTARSDHASFQDNLGTVTVGFGGLVDGYWCYHQTCDTLDEMEDWMDTSGKGYGDENTGVSNLVDSLDIITWWASYCFFHLDEKPVLNTIV